MPWRLLSASGCCSRPTEHFSHHLAVWHGLSFFATKVPCKTNHVDGHILGLPRLCMSLTHILSRSLYLSLGAVRARRPPDRQSDFGTSNDKSPTNSEAKVAALDASRSLMTHFAQFDGRTSSRLRRPRVVVATNLFPCLGRRRRLLHLLHHPLPLLPSLLQSGVCGVHGNLGNQF